MSQVEPGQYIEAAHRAWRFIDQQRSDDGACWNKTPSDGFAGHTHYTGTAGILLFLMQLAEASGDAGLRERVNAPAEVLLKWVPTAAISSANKSSGWTSYQNVFTRLWEFTGDERYRDAAALCVARAIDASSPIGAGVGWLEPAPFSEITGLTGEVEAVDLGIGAAGVILGLLAADATGLDDRALPTAIAAGERLLELGEQKPEGIEWGMMHPMLFPFPAPNYSHGSAGVALALAELARRTGRNDFLDAAVAGMRYALAQRKPHGEGHLIVHREDIDPPVFYAGVCHGPPGTGRTLLVLAELTGSPEWTDALVDLMKGLDGIGAPTTRSPGLWQNYGQCCGDAGMGDFALMLDQQGIWEGALDHARACGESIMNHAVDLGADGLAWDQCEHRDRPDFVERQVGYMQGAAGIGAFLLRLGNYLNGTPLRSDRLEDS